ncbi:MAG: RDD family protein [Thermodesulfovibrionales bacterium]
MTEGARASLLLRMVSKGVDFVLIFAAAEALPKAGWLAGIGYLLISDGLFDGRSVGKRLTGLQVITESGAPCGVRESILRNVTLAIGLLLWKIPFLGWLFLAAVTAGELIILVGSKEGRRLGDEIARTSVVETVKAVQET